MCLSALQHQDAPFSPDSPRQVSQAQTRTKQIQNVSAPAGEMWNLNGIEIFLGTQVAVDKHLPHLPAESPIRSAAPLPPAVHCIELHCLVPGAHR